MKRSSSINPSTRNRSSYPRAITLGAMLFCVAAVVTQSGPLLAIEFFEIIEEEHSEQNQNQHGFRIEQFDQWVFSGQQTVEEAKAHLLGRLKSEAKSIQSICQLMDDQNAKLMLAGRGDIQAFMQEYAETRAKFEGNIDNQQAMQNIWQEIQPLQKKYQGKMFGEASLFAKVLEHMLDQQQSLRWQQLQREQRAFQYQATFMYVIALFDQVAPLTQENREQLLALIDQYTFPPKSIPSVRHDHLLTSYIYSQLAEIPEDELRPLFREAPWKIIRSHRKRGKRMKRELKKQGMVPDKG